MHKIINKDSLLLLIIAVVAIVIGGIFTLVQNSNNTPLEFTATSEENLTDEGAAESPLPSEAKIMIDIKGCVNNPGLYSFDEEIRVGEAIEAAGGFTDDAYTDGINLAERIYDGQEIYVDKKYSSGSSGSSGSSSSKARSSSSTAKEPPISASNKLNINTATKNKLEQLPGIGSVLSDRIIAYRQNNGEFKQISDIMKVSGIGAKKFEAMKDLITVE